MLLAVLAKKYGGFVNVDMNGKLLFIIEIKAEVVALYSSMTPERFFEHTENTRIMAESHAREKEQEEIVCRLLASGMSADEIAVILCIRVDVVRIIQDNHAARKIPDYVKTLKERHKRRQKAAEKLLNA